MVLRRVLIIDDEENILASLKGVLEDEGFIVETTKTGNSGLQKMRRFAPDVVLLDIWLPDQDGIRVLEKMKQMDFDPEVIMMSGHGTVETAVKAIKLGAFDFLEKPIHFEKLLILLRHVFELKDLQSENRQLREELEHEDVIIGNSDPIQKLRKLIDTAAPSNGWVLIQGENGTGKELVARALHHGSQKFRGRFVAVNCAAIPDELVESELFGYERGAFTGAQEKKVGKFERAHGGTLFLDEIGDMSSKMQAKILRALQESAIQRVGGDQSIRLDLRVIAATNKDLAKAIDNGGFREDLYFRLNVIPIHVPALRNRREDIPLLVTHFLKRYCGGKMRRLDDTVLQLVIDYPWTGNVRELKNWVERVCILSQSEVIDSSYFEEHMVQFFRDRGLRESPDPPLGGGKTLKFARSTFEKQFIIKMLAENGGNISKTANAMGMERSHLHKKIKSYGISPEPEKIDANT